MMVDETVEKWADAMVVYLAGLSVVETVDHLVASLVVAMVGQMVVGLVAS